MRSLWELDPSVAYLNHGSYGACPTGVLKLQQALRLEMEREPVDFLSRRLPQRLDAARAALASFLGADPADLVFVPNVTTAVNAVLRSLELEPGEELLATTHTYAACQKTLDYAALRQGVQVVVAQLPFPLESEEEIVAAILARVSPRTRLALIDHVTSPTALVLPIARLVEELRARGVETLVDGAHAPGMVPLAIAELEAAYYAGSAQKWLCAPKGSAFLHVRADRHQGLHPCVISHGYGAGLQAEFDWPGTFDPTPWLCIPAVLELLGGMVPGGWAEVMARNRALALRGRAVLAETLGIPASCPDEMIGAMASLPLPLPAAGAPAAALDRDALANWFRDRGVETFIAAPPFRILRLSAALYNDLDEVRRLATLMMESLGAPEL
ncbi:MAG: aminotransferase class V-fold PLP-dependent enzyme [Gammaproteobacteria bacterium]|nr:aminotransferase class V-fold PLP-dependent enzyme [Gammaproteobacteria bacterium]